MLGRGIMKFIDREPIAAVSLAIGFVGFSLPVIVPPIRESMGFKTQQVLKTSIIYCLLQTIRL